MLHDSLLRAEADFVVRKVFAKGDSGRARNLFFTPYLDFEAKVFRHNRPINPHKPMRIHFHSNKNILTDSRRVGQCTRFSNPTFRIIGVLTYFSNIKNGKNNFFKLNSRYYIKIRAANLLRTSFEIRCEPTVEAKRTTSMWLLYKYGKYRTLGGRLLAQLLHVYTPQSWQLDSKCATVSDSKAQVKCNL